MRKFMKILVRVVIILIILIIIAYFFITSSYFLTNYILPMAGKGMGANISANRASISLLSGNIEAENLSIEKKDEYSVKTNKLDLDFSLLGLLSNKITVNKFILDDTHIDITNRITKEDIEKEQKLAQEQKEGLYSDTNPEEKVEMPYFDISNVKVTNLNLTYHAIRPEGLSSSITTVKNFNLNMPNIKTGGKGKLSFDGIIETLNDKDQHKLTGNIEGKLDTDLNDESFPKELDFHSKFKLGNDVAPINVKFTSGTENDGKMPFTIKGDLSNLPLDPFMSLNKSYEESGGKIVSADINMSGPDVQSANLMKTLSGEIDAQVIRLYIPTELMNNPLGKLIMLPINIVAGSGKYFTTNNAEANNAKNVISESAQVLNSIKTINFDNGRVKVHMDDGNIFVREFLFNGASNSVVQRLSIQGTISKEEKLDLNTETMITALAVPIKITGTVENPKPDVARMIPALLGHNIKNIATFAKDGVQAIGDGLSQSGRDALNEAYGEENVKYEGAPIEPSSFFNKVGKSLDDVIYGVKNAVSN